MTLEEIIEYLKESITPESIDKMNIKDKLSMLNALEEFNNPKLMRTSYNVNPELPDTIKIEVIENS